MFKINLKTRVPFKPLLHFCYLLLFKVVINNISAYKCLNIFFTFILLMTWVLGHPGLTRVKCIRFLLFEIKRVLIYNLTIFKLTDLFIYILSLKMYMPSNKYFKDWKVMYNGSTCERKFELYEILTKLLNPREGVWTIFKY